MNGKQFELPMSKKTLVENALKKGIPEDLMQKIFDNAAVLSTGDESTTVSGKLRSQIFTTSVHESDSFSLLLGEVSFSEPFRDEIRTKAY